MPIKEKIVVIIQDNEGSWQFLLKEFITTLNGLPSILLENMVEATDWLDEQENLSPEKKMLVLAFVVDGQLTPGMPLGMEGENLIKRIRQIPQFDESVIIGNSARRELAGADYNMEKDGRLMDQLVPWINGGRKTE